MNEKYDVTAIIINTYFEVLEFGPPDSHWALHTFDSSSVSDLRLPVMWLACLSG